MLLLLYHHHHHHHHHPLPASCTGAWGLMGWAAEGSCEWAGQGRAVWCVCGACDAQSGMGAGGKEAWLVFVCVLRAHTNAPPCMQARAWAAMGACTHARTLPLVLVACAVVTHACSTTWCV